MKNENPIRTLLGISQLDAAMLLKVHLSQWSMFECGQRDLPLRARQELAEMLAFVRSCEASMRTDKKQHQADLKQLELLLQENRYQQALLEKKIITAEKKLKNQQRLNHLAEYLRTSKSGTTEAIHHTIISRAAKSALANSAADVLKYELRKEVLDYEKLQIESKIKLIRSKGGIEKVEREE